MDLEGKRERNGRHVASVYFATRGMNLGPEDQFMLKMLAAEYANTAKKNRGLKGTVTGHADIRPSTNPDNATLAGNRAFYTARSLKKCLAQATQIEVGRFEFIAKGEEDRACRGDQRCITAGDPQALANYRRADVHILTPYAKPIPFRPPDLDHIRFPRVDSDLVPRILKEDKRAMKDMVIVAIGDVEGLVQRP